MDTGSSRYWRIQDCWDSELRARIALKAARISQAYNAVSRMWRVV
jgi:hypothetical protein